MHIPIPIHIYMHTHIHIYTHTHTQPHKYYICAHVPPHGISAPACILFLPAATHAAIVPDGVMPPESNSARRQPVAIPCSSLCPFACSHAPASAPCLLPLACLLPSTAAQRQLSRRLVRANEGGKRPLWQRRNALHQSFPTRHSAHDSVQGLA